MPSYGIYGITVYQSETVKSNTVVQTSMLYLHTKSQINSLIQSLLLKYDKTNKHEI